MRKIDKSVLSFIERRNKKTEKAKIKIATSRKRAKRKRFTNTEIRIRILKENRAKILGRIFGQVKYHGARRIVYANKQIGLEEEAEINNFLDFAESIIDFDATSLRIDLHKCERVWPSGITLMCSLKQWVEIAASIKRINQPEISSSNSDYDGVNSYLSHCGFHDYVNRLSGSAEHKYDDKHVVKIRREKKKNNIEIRELEICSLLKAVTNFDSDEIEFFDSVILTEIFNNVYEHGITSRDKGWWLLAQYHEKHKIISLNIADNGVGFRHTLMTGPQKNQLLKTLENKKEYDGEFIKEAMKENVSGAYNASTKTGLIKKYERGERRGNGLERIKSACIQLGISLAILSHYGYVLYGKSGNLKLSGYRNNRIFAGTLYNLIIPVKR